MGKVPEHLRQIIARNIRNARLAAYPGRGGAGKCAEAFGVSPQQWSPWERGTRTPDEVRLANIAAFFGVTVEWLRRDHGAPAGDAATPPPSSFPPFPTLEPSLHGRSWQQSAPGTPASFFWLAHHLITHLQVNGLRLDKESLEYLARLLRAGDAEPRPASEPESPDAPGSIPPPAL